MLLLLARRADSGRGWICRLKKSSVFIQRLVNLGYRLAMSVVSQKARAISPIVEA